MNIVQFGLLLDITGAILVSIDAFGFKEEEIEAFCKKMKNNTIEYISFFKSANTASLFFSGSKDLLINGIGLISGCSFIYLTYLLWHQLDKLYNYYMIFFTPYRLYILLPTIIIIAIASIIHINSRKFDRTTFNILRYSIIPLAPAIILILSPILALHLLAFITILVAGALAWLSLKIKSMRVLGVLFLITGFVFQMAGA